MCTSKGLMEYVGSKITAHCDDSGLPTTKFTHPVLVGKLWEEYGSIDRPASQLLTVAGQILMKGDGDGTLKDSEAKMYQSAVATYMYIMQ